MKKTLLLLSLAVGVPAANASVLLVTFGTNSGFNQTTTLADYMSVSSTWNVLSTDVNTGKTYTGLKDSDGADSSITVTTTVPVCGAGGMVNTIAGDTSGLFSTFGASAITGSATGGCANVAGDTRVTLNNLVVDQVYSLTMFIGRGNQYAAGSTTYDFFSGAGDVTLNILDGTASYNTSGSSFTANTNSPSAGNTAANWLLVNYTFTATATSVAFQTTGGSGNIGAFALTPIPEPATASLGLLGLTALMARRRKA